MKNLDGEVFTYKGKKELIIKYLDENEFRKKKKALARYFSKCNKYLTFKVLPKLKETGKTDGLYELELPIDEIFKKVYGKVALKFLVKNDVAYIEDVTPKFLTTCYEKDLPTYKGIPYETEKDLFKIKMEETICQKMKEKESTR